MTATHCLCLVGCSLALLCSDVESAEQPHLASQIEAHFDDCTEAVVRELSEAKQLVHVQAYSLTSKEIARALVDAENRGVEVVVIADASNRTAHYSAADFLAHEGIETYIDSRHKIAHNKIVIIDSAVVITGSFNFTRGAEDNAENVVVIRDAKIAGQFEGNWQKHFHHSEYYAGR